jgi:hypothetical protein
MSVNNHRPHVLVLPEDDANRQIANGFQLDVPSRQLQVLVEAGGWMKVWDCFERDYIYSMERFQNRHVVLLIDLDDQNNRREFVASKIPVHLTNRVFVLSTRTEPERLKSDLGSYETIGRALAKDCRENTDATWSHRLLQHNADEVKRLRDQVHSILFS